MKAAVRRSRASPSVNIVKSNGSGGGDGWCVRAVDDDDDDDDDDRD